MFKLYDIFILQYYSIQRIRHCQKQYCGKTTQPVYCSTLVCVSLSVSVVPVSVYLCVSVPVSVYLCVSVPAHL